MAKKKMEFIGGPWDGMEKEVEVASVLSVTVNTVRSEEGMPRDENARVVKYYLRDGAYHFGDSGA